MPKVLVRGNEDRNSATFRSHNQHGPARRGESVKPVKLVKTQDPSARTARLVRCARVFENSAIFVAWPLARSYPQASGPCLKFARMNGIPIWDEREMAVPLCSFEA